MPHAGYVCGCISSMCISCDERDHALHSRAPLRVNVPCDVDSFITLPARMRAKKAPIATLTPADLGVDLTPQLITVQVSRRHRHNNIFIMCCKLSV